MGIIGPIIPPITIPQPIIDLTNQAGGVVNRFTSYWGNRPDLSDPEYVDRLRFTMEAGRQIYGADGSIDWHDTVDILNLAQSISPTDNEFHSMAFNLFSGKSDGGSLNDLTTNQFLIDEYQNAPHLDGTLDNSNQQHHIFAGAVGWTANVNNWTTNTLWEGQNLFTVGEFNWNDMVAFGLGRDLTREYVLKGPEAMIELLKTEALEGETPEEKAAREALLAQIQEAYENGEYDPDHPELLLSTIELPPEIDTSDSTPSQDEASLPNTPVTTNGAPAGIPADAWANIPPSVQSYILQSNAQANGSGGAGTPVTPNSSGSPDDRDENNAESRVPPVTTTSNTVGNTGIPADAWQHIPPSVQANILSSTAQNNGQNNTPTQTSPPANSSGSPDDRDEEKKVKPKKETSSSSSTGGTAGSTGGGGGNHPHAVMV